MRALGLSCSQANSGFASPLWPFSLSPSLSLLPPSPFYLFLSRPPLLSVCLPLSPLSLSPLCAVSLSLSPSISIFSLLTLLSLSPICLSLYHSLSILSLSLSSLSLFSSFSFLSVSLSFYLSLSPVSEIGLLFRIMLLCKCLAHS